MQSWHGLLAQWHLPMLLLLMMAVELGLLRRRPCSLLRMTKLGMSKWLNCSVLIELLLISHLLALAHQLLGTAKMLVLSLVLVLNLC